MGKYFLWTASVLYGIAVAILIDGNTKLAVNFVLVAGLCVLIGALDIKIENRVSSKTLIKPKRK